MIGQKEPIKFHSHNLPLPRRRRPSYCWSAVNVALEDVTGNVAARNDVINVFHKITGPRGCALIRGRCFCEAGLKITTKHVSNSLVTHERFVVLFFLPSCCVNSLMSGQTGDLVGLKLLLLRDIVGNHGRAAHEK